MRTLFAYAAIAAAAASANARHFDHLKSPDFVAGMMYVITGNNNLTEIKSCFTGSETFFRYLWHVNYGYTLSGKIFIDEWSMKEFVNKLNEEFAANMVTCPHSMQNDIDVFSEWASALK